MKKLYFALFSLLLLASFPALAQKGLYFGLAGTFQNTWITNQNNYGRSEMDEKLTFGGAGNLNVGFDFTNHIGIKMEVGYGKYGQKYTDSQDTGKLNYDRHVTLNYLTIPIMFKYRTGGSIAKFYLAVGPQICMLMSASQSYNLNGQPFLVEVNDTITGNSFKIGQEEMKERFNSMDIMARIDLGVDITVVKHLMIEIGLKMGYGFKDLNSNSFHIKDHSGAYHPSHNAFGGLSIGLNYRL